MTEIQLNLSYSTTEHIKGTTGGDIEFGVDTGGVIKIPSGIGLTFGSDGEKIEGDGTDLTVTGNNINLTAVAAVNITGGVSSTQTTTLASVSGVTTIGAATAATVSAAGLLNINNTTEATSTTDGSLQTDGGLSVSKSAVIGDDLDLLSNSAIFKIGSDQPFTLTHSNASNTVLATADHRLAFGDAGDYISGDGTDLKIVSSGDVDITGDTDIAGGLSSTQTTTLASVSGVTTIGAATAATVSAAGLLNINNTTEATSTTDGSLQTDGGLSVAKSAVIGDDLDLLSNSAIFKIGSDQPFTLTHSNASNTVLATANHRLAFGDAGDYISGDGNDLKIVSSGDVDITGDTDIIGGVSSTKTTTLASLEGVTTIGSASAATVSADGLLNINNTTDATSATNGSLQTNGGLSVAKKAYIGETLTVEQALTVGAYTLTNTDGNANQVLKTDGSGFVSFQNEAAASNISHFDVGDSAQFANSLIVGHTTTGTLSTATGNIGVGVGVTGPLSAISSGTDNTAVGHLAGNAITTGIGNTFIGAGAGGSNGNTNNNNTCIGSGAIVTAGVSNEFNLGNGNVGVLRCATQAIASLSDRRDKSNIVDSSYGLSFVDTLRPVQFTWDKRNLQEGDATCVHNGKTRVGFIAQELQSAMPNNENEILDLVYESNPERIEAKYGNLIPILTKAIQELKQANDALSARVVALESA
jgi:trimeric autotransporter adhesin